MPLIRGAVTVRGAGGGEYNPFFVCVGLKNESQSNHIRGKEGKKQPQRQLEDEPTPGENDLLFLVIKF